MPFDEIKGQAKAKVLLGRALTSGRLAHAYLFVGQDGTGKATMARLLAQCLLCVSRDKAPCGNCPGCIKFASGTHPDYLWIQPEGAAIKIDQVRALKKQLRFAPLEASLRVVVIEEVHTMRREAGNSLLKVLEEPPADNLLVLIGEESETVLATIRSRCQVIPFFPLPEMLAAEVIRRVTPEIKTERALILASLAEGCPGQALALQTGQVLDRFQELLAGLTGFQNRLPERVETALRLAGTCAALKEGHAMLLTLLRMFLKNTLAVQGGLEQPLPFAAEMRRARELWNLPMISDMLQAVDFAEQALDRNCNKALLFEVLMLDIMGCISTET